MSRPTVKSKKRDKRIIIAACIMVAVCFLAAVKLLSGAVDQYYEKKMTVCIDAGHGGSDSGATSTDGKRKEKDDNLNLALKVRDKLEAMGVEVIMTRDDDTFVELKQRCKIANKSRCALFVSLHRNSSATGTGFEAWVSKIPKRNEEELAEKMLERLSQTGGSNRGVKKGYRSATANNYYVNANTNMPSILLEVGFVSDDSDNKNFDKNIDEYAKIIAEEIYSEVS